MVGEVGGGAGVADGDFEQVDGEAGAGRFLDSSSSWVSFRAKNPSEVRMLVSLMTTMSWA